jgi:hypothetical protein
MLSASRHAAGPIPFIALHNEQVSVKPARHRRLIPAAFGETVRPEI